MSKRRVYEHRSEDEDPWREGGRMKTPESDEMSLLGTEASQFCNRIGYKSQICIMRG